MSDTRTRLYPLRPWIIHAALWGLICHLAACSESDKADSRPYPQVSCASDFRYASEDPSLDVAVVGSFNQWSPGNHPLEYDPEQQAYLGSYYVGEGLIPYRFSVNSETLLDSENPLTIFGRDGLEHSALDMEECRSTHLVVLTSKLENDTYSLELEFQAQKGGSPLWPESVDITLDDNLITPDLQTDVDRGYIAFQVQAGLGKHNLSVQASDQNGHVSNRLTLPFWIEEQPFTWNDAVIYQIITDRFRKGQSSLDDHDITQRMGGDFAGIVQAIEDGYFQKLGANVLWISPAYANVRGQWDGFDGRRYESYHGYWAVAPREVDELWGGEDALDTLVATAHEHGMRLILDVVPNHVHVKHPYFQNHRYEWFNHPDIDCVCGLQCSWTKDIEHCWFTEYLADLDWTNSEVVDTMEEDNLWWLRRFNLDGLRIDAVAMMPRLATRHLRHRVTREFDQGGQHTYLIGETFTGEGGRSDIRASLGPYGLSGQFDFPVMWSLRSVIGQDSGKLSDVLDALDASEESFGGSGAVMGMIVGNHDVPRFLSLANGDTIDDPLSPPSTPTTQSAYNKLGLAFAVLMTTPGAPIIYYGDEYGQSGAGDPDNRRAMRFENAWGEHEQTLWNTVSHLGRLRSLTPAFRHGTRQDLLRKSDLIAYTMTSDEDLGLVVINRAMEAAKVDLDTLPDGMNSTDSTQWADCFGAPLTFENDSLTLVVPPQGMAVILKKDRCDEASLDEI